MAPPKVQKFSPPPRGGGEGKEKITQTASLTLYRYSPFSGTKNGVHLRCLTSDRDTYSSFY